MIGLGQHPLRLARKCQKQVSRMLESRTQWISQRGGRSRRASRCESSSQLWIIDVRGSSPHDSELNWAVTGKSTSVTRETTRSAISVSGVELDHCSTNKTTLAECRGLMQPPLGLPQPLPGPCAEGRISKSTKVLTVEPRRRLGTESVQYFRRSGWSGTGLGTIVFRHRLFVMRSCYYLILLSPFLKVNIHPNTHIPTSP